MPSLISERSLADLAGVSIATDAEVVGLGVRSLLTSTIADVWRTPGVVQAAVSTALAHDDTAGAALGSDTVRQGTEAGTDGTAGLAVQYRNNSAANAYVRLAGAYQVVVGRQYRVDLAIKRRAGNTTSGNVIHVALPDGSLAVLPMSALAQGNAWQAMSLTFTPATSGAAVIYAAVNTGAFEYSLDVSSVTLLPVFTAGSRAVALDLDLGSAQAVRVLALAAPPDGMLPAGGSLIRVTAGTVAGGSDLLDSGNRPLAMPRGYWAWIGAAVVTARYWRIQINWPGSQPYLQFGRLWLGDALVPPIGFASDGYDASVVTEAGLAPRRKVQFTLPWLEEDDAEALDAIGLRVGSNRQVLVIPEVGRWDVTALIGKFLPPPASRPTQPEGLFSANLSLQEDR